MALVTVVVPTHSHSGTLRFSVASALAQSVQDLEILVVGDGVTEATRHEARELERADRRVRFLDFPKGERHGERNRHLALQEATGRVVCYLSDDDLWLPGHVAQICEMLERVDFATTVRLAVRPSGEFEIERVDLAVPYIRERILTGVTNVPLTCAGHTLRMYRDLPIGWRAAPATLSPTLYMWQQFMAHSSCRAMTGTQVSSINFPDSWRTGWTTEARAQEIAPLAARLADPLFAGQLTEWALTSALYKWAMAEGRFHDLERHVAYLQARIETLELDAREARPSPAAERERYS